jgi:adenosine deaminase
MCQHLPKLELHAHLSGTVRESTLRELCLASGQDPDTKRFHLETVSAEASYEKVWEDTVEAFANIRTLTASDINVLRRIATEAVEMHAKDGCVYYEIRTGLKALPDRRTFLSELISTLKYSQAKYGLITRLIASVDRGASIAECKETIDVVVQAFQHQNQCQTTGIGAGVLVGVEMGGNPNLGDWKRDFAPHFLRARRAGLKVSLHFAENEGNEREHGDILDFIPDRLGHAVYMSESITERLLQLRIPVEVCMTCHKAFYKVPFASNILGTFLKHKHPAILCCDNASLLQTLPSKEWAIAIETFGLTAVQVSRLVMDAVESIFADGITKDKVEGRLQNVFSQSCVGCTRQENQKVEGRL